MQSAVHVIQICYNQEEIRKSVICPVLRRKFYVKKLLFYVFARFFVLENRISFDKEVRRTMNLFVVKNVSIRACMCIRTEKC